MADAQKTIDLIFNGIDKTGAATQAALDNAKKFSGSVQSIAAPIADFSIGALKLEAGLLAAGLAMTVFAVNSAGKFEGAMLDLKKVLNETDGPIEQFGEASKKMGLEFGVSSTEVLASVANFKQAGFTAGEALQLTRDALNLKIAGDIDAARSSDLLVASMKGFGLEASESARVVDLLNQVSNEYATDVSQLAEGFAKLSPVAKAAGLSLEETAGILTPGIEVFRSGAEVANAMRTVLLRLQDDSKPVQEALKSIGVAQSGTNGELRSARDIYFDVAKAFGGLSDNQKTYYAMQLAGIDQSAKFIAVMDGVGKTLRISGSDFQYMGSAVKEVEIKLAAFEVKAGIAGVALENMFIDIGAPLLDEFGGIADAITNIFSAIGEGAKNGGLADLSTYVQSVFKDIQTSLEAVAKNLPEALAKADFSGFKGGIEAVVNAIKNLFGNVDITSAQGLTTIIETMGVAFLGLSKYVAGMIKSFEPLFNTLVDVGQGTTKVNLSFLEFAGNIGGIATQLNIVMPLFTSLVGILAVKQGLGLITELKALPAALAAAGAAAGTTGLAGALGTAGLAGAFGLAGYNLGTALNPAIDSLVSKISGTKTTLGGFIYDLVNSEKNAKALGTGAEGAAAGVSKIGAAIASAGTAAGSAQADFRKTEIAFQNTSASVGETNKAMLANFAASEKAAESTGKLGTAQNDLSTYALKTVPIFDNLTGKITGYEQQLVKTEGGTIKLGKASDTAGKDLAKIATETEKAKDAQEKWNQEVAKMAFQEKLQLIESQTKITTAQIEGDTKKTVAAFDSLSKGIESTGNVLGTLYGQYKDFDKMSSSTQKKIEDAANKEGKRRDDAFELQKELTDAQIAQMKAQTAALLKGDGLIKIDGAGLKPHLEAMMWEVLKAIQVRVNKDGLKLLLGT